MLSPSPSMFLCFVTLLFCHLALEEYALC